VLTASSVMCLLQFFVVLFALLTGEVLGGVWVFLNTDEVYLIAS